MTHLGVHSLLGKTDTKIEGIQRKEGKEREETVWTMNGNS